jgi:hypothetical protein
MAEEDLTQIVEETADSLLVEDASFTAAFEYLKNLNGGYFIVYTTAEMQPNVEINVDRSEGKGIIYLDIKQVEPNVQVIRATHESQYVGTPDGKGGHDTKSYERPNFLEDALLNVGFGYTERLPNMGDVHFMDREEEGLNPHIKYHSVSEIDTKMGMPEGMKTRLNFMLGDSDAVFDVVDALLADGHSVVVPKDSYRADPFYTLTPMTDHKITF